MQHPSQVGVKAQVGAFSVNRLKVLGVKSVLDFSLCPTNKQFRFEFLMQIHRLVQKLPFDSRLVKVACNFLFFFT